MANSYLIDGQSTLINLTGAGVVFAEKSLQPPKVSVGAVSTQTMRNNSVMTQRPKKLKKYDKITIKVRYDPAVYNTAQLGVNQLIQIVWPNAKTLTFWGWMDDFDPDALEHGKEAEATIILEVSCEDNSGNEVLPVQT